MQRLFVIKIGGNVIDRIEALDIFLTRFSKIQEPKILIHGGGAIATRIGEKLQIKSNYVNGRRITDAETLDLVTMVYGGLINKKIVARLQQLGSNAMGVTGADGNLLNATKRKPGTVDYGFVGDLTNESVNQEFLCLLLNNNIIPVFAPLTHTDGTMLNTNADTIASTIAVAMSNHFNVRLIYCFEKAGVLEDVNDPTSVITKLDQKKYANLLNAGVLHDGILPKLENAFEAIRSGVKEVLIGDAEHLEKNTSAETTGTLITL
jgi:acetylglutamate kinase